MAGYIDNSTDLALFESYSQGRALAGASLTNLSRFAQWSALLDDRTCDWCSWADLRVFDTNIEPYDPPMHHGCRCLVANITKDEFPPKADWGKGPPSDVWPPGTYKVQQAVEKAVKAAPKPSGPLVGTTFEVDSLKTVAQVEEWFADKGINAVLDGMSPAKARDTARAVEKFINAYPEYQRALGNIGTQKAFNLNRSLRATVTEEGALAAVEISPGQFVSTDMVITTRKIQEGVKIRGGFATDAGHEGTVWHELGHVAENWSVQNVNKAHSLRRRLLKEVYDEDVVLLGKDISKYGTYDGHELFAEFFHIANQPGGIAEWATSVEQEGRLRKMFDFFNDNGFLVRETQL